MSGIYCSVTCPFCGLSHDIRVELAPYFKPVAIICENDDGGGCREVFVYQPIMNIEFDYWTTHYDMYNGKPL